MKRIKPNAIRTAIMRTYHRQRKIALHNRQINLGLFHSKLSQSKNGDRHYNEKTRAEISIKMDKDQGKKQEFLSYCHNCWLYGHKRKDCRKEEQTHPSYEHLDEFIAKQKEKAEQNVDADLLAIYTHAKPSCSDPAQTKSSNKSPNNPPLSRKMEEGSWKEEHKVSARVSNLGTEPKENHIIPSWSRESRQKVFSVQSLDRQLRIFAKTKYAKPVLGYGIAKADNTGHLLQCRTDDPLSAKGEGRTLSAQAPPMSTFKQDHTWQTVKGKNKVLRPSPVHSTFSLSLKNSFELLSKEGNSRYIYSPPHKRNGVLGDKGYRARQHKMEVNHSKAVKPYPYLSKTPPFCGGKSKQIGRDCCTDDLMISNTKYYPPHLRKMERKSSFLDSNNRMNNDCNNDLFHKALKPAAYSPPQRRSTQQKTGKINHVRYFETIFLDNNSILQQQKHLAETGVICIWNGSGVHVNDLMAKLSLQLPKEMSEDICVNMRIQIDASEGIEGC